MEANQSHSGTERAVPARSWAFAPLIPILALFAPAAAAQGGRDPIEAVRNAYEQYTEVRRTISKEREDWRKAKRTLEASMKVVDREIEALDVRIAEAQKSIDDAEAKFRELEEEKAERKAEIRLLEDTITQLEERTLALLERVPPPLAGNVEAISQLIPRSAEQREGMRLDSRYGYVIGVLNAIDKWNREITVTTEMRAQPTGESVRVSVIYVGLGQAYYVGGKGADGKPNVAGTGSVGRHGWTWTPANELAPAVQLAVSIYRNEQLAKLVRLPVQIL